MVYEKGEKDAGWYKRCDSVIENTIQFINYASSHHMSVLLGAQFYAMGFSSFLFCSVPTKAPRADRHLCTMRDLEMDEAWGLFADIRRHKSSETKQRQRKRLSERKSPHDNPQYQETGMMQGNGDAGA